MKSFVVWLENRISTMGGFFDYVIRAEWNGLRLLLNFSTQGSKPKNQPYEPQVVVKDKSFINNLMSELSADEKILLQNGEPVYIKGEKAEKIVKDNINRSELGWESVGRYYDLKPQLSLWNRQNPAGPSH